MPARDRGRESEANRGGETRPGWRGVEMVQTLDKKDSGKDKRRLVSNRTERHASVIFSLPLSRGECAILKSGRAASLIKFEIQVWRGTEAGGTTGRVGKFGEFTPRLFPITIILLKLIKYI